MTTDMTTIATLLLDAMSADWDDEQADKQIDAFVNALAADGRLTRSNIGPIAAALASALPPLMQEIAARLPEEEENP